MERRAFLRLGAAASLAVLGGCRWWPEQGMRNPCLGPLPERLREHELVKAAWEGIEAAKVWDCHAHLVGLGDGGSGAWVNPRMDSWAHPFQMAQKRFYFNAACIPDQRDSVDAGYAARLLALMDDLPEGAKLMLLAFDRNVEESGTQRDEHSTFYLPNDYAQALAAKFPGRFEWAASIHPYRSDALARLDLALRGGAKAVKWLPAAQGIDPAGKRCDKFYEMLVRHDLPLVVHAGKEQAVEGGGAADFGNPLRLRRALDHGVRVVVAHCASLGEDRDLDKGHNGPYVKSFDLFARLMDEARYEKKLFADISAVTQVNRVDVLPALLSRSEWHGRLLNGSDYPLPGVMPLFSASLLADMKLLERKAVPVLKEIRAHNALLFDFVLKRHLARDKQRFDAGVFETRGFFTRKETRRS
jgi:mannonate dehydratase